MCSYLLAVNCVKTIWRVFVDCNVSKIDDFVIFQNFIKYNLLPGSGTYLTLGVHSEVRDNDLCCFGCTDPKQTLYGDLTLHMFLFARVKNTKTNSDFHFLIKTHKFQILCFSLKITHKIWIQRWMYADVSIVSHTQPFDEMIYHYWHPFNLEITSITV